MEVHEIMSYIIMPLGGLLIAIIGYFLKKVLKDSDEMEKELNQILIQHEILKKTVEENAKTITKNEDTMFKKFTNIHARQEVQSELLNTVKNELAGINAKLEILVKDKK